MDRAAAARRATSVAPRYLSLAVSEVAPAEVVTSEGPVGNFGRLPVVLLPCNVRRLVEAVAADRFRSLPCNSDICSRNT